MRRYRAAAAMRVPASSVEVGSSVRPRCPRGGARRKIRASGGLQRWGRDGVRVLFELPGQELLCDPPYLPHHLAEWPKAGSVVAEPRSGDRFQCLERLERPFDPRRPGPCTRPSGPGRRPRRRSPERSCHRRSPADGPRASRRRLPPRLHTRGPAPPCALMKSCPAGLRGTARTAGSRYPAIHSRGAAR